MAWSDCVVAGVVPGAAPLAAAELGVGFAEAAGCADAGAEAGEVPAVGAPPGVLEVDGAATLEVEGAAGVAAAPGAAAPAAFEAVGSGAPVVGESLLQPAAMRSAAA